MSTSNTTSITNYFDTTAWMKWSLIPVCAIFILFCFLEKRVNLWPTCCCGRPGVALLRFLILFANSPVNLVDSYTNRWAFAFAFGSMSTFLMNEAYGPLLLLPYSIDHTDIMLQGTVQICAYLIDALVISLVFYPILLCLQTRWRLLGNILGLLYSIPWLAFYIGNIIVTAHDITGQNEALSEKKIFFKTLKELSLFGSGVTFFIALIISFLVGLTKEFMKGIKVGYQTDHDTPRVNFDKTHFYHRVKFLLTPPLPPKTSGNVILHLFRKYIGTVPGFRFSRRNICTLVLTVATTIQIVLRWIDSFEDLLRFVNDWAASPEIRKSNPGLDETTKNLEITFWITSVVAVIFTAICTIDMQLRYRKHTVMLWRGDRSFTPVGKLPFSETLVASLRYSGYHVAFTIGGFLAMQLLLWAILSFIIIFKDYAFTLLKKYWLTLAITFTFYYGQVFISQFFFLQKASDQDNRSRLSCCRQTSFGLDNRRVFHVAVYILLFVNFFLGIFSCFIRISKSLVLGTLYIGRLDRLLLMRDWEVYDKGYTAYVGFLQLEVAHTHPVLITFCHFLLKTVKTNQATSQKYTSNELVSIVNAEIESGYDVPETTNGRCYSPEDVTTNQLSRRVRNRWMVALTLAHNPKLVAERKRTLKQTVSSISDDIANKDVYTAREAHA